MGLDEAQLGLSSHPTSASAARRFVREVLTSWGATEDHTHSVLLCTHELVTNAIVHAGSDIRVVVRRTDDVTRVEVSDQDSRPPLRRVRAVDAEAGRGLQLVEGLSDRWGVLPADGGKIVWFEVRRDG